MATAYRLKISGVEPAEWLESIAVAPPSLLPSWPDSPHLAVVVASVGPDAATGADAYASVLVVCTRDRLRVESAVDPLVRKLYFHVWRDQLLESAPGLAGATFE